MNMQKEDAAKKKPTNGAGLLLFFAFALIGGVIWAERSYMPTFEAEFRRLNRQVVETANALTTARIINEDLELVRELVFSNMSFPGQPDSVDHETQFFEFITECINDLKLELISIRPIAPTTADRITTYGYEIEIFGDFFRFGELNAKFENNRRIVSVESFNVTQQAASENQQARLGQADGHGIRARMRINTYRVSKPIGGQAS